MDSKELIEATEQQKAEYGMSDEKAATFLRAWRTESQFDWMDRMVIDHALAALARDEQKANECCGEVGGHIPECELGVLRWANQEDGQTIHRLEIELDAERKRVEAYERMMGLARRVTFEYAPEVRILYYPHTRGVILHYRERKGDWLTDPTVDTDFYGERKWKAFGTPLEAFEALSAKEQCE